MHTHKTACLCKGSSATASLYLLLAPSLKETSLTSLSPFQLP